VINKSLTNNIIKIHYFAINNGIFLLRNTP